MDPNVERVQEQVVVSRPGERREVVTERIQRVPRESGISGGWVAVIVLLGVLAIGAIVYVVSNRNANEAANRNANIDVASQNNREHAPPVVQQPAAAQQAPVIIQQPAQQAPVIVQQPSLRDNASDDANMQEVATKRLNDEPDMTTVSITISEARAVLTGTVNSAATKAKAEQVVKAVRGVKSVDNKIVVSG
jgi:BON domain